MKALQTHYTSCRRGLSGRPGYQFRALTPGIEPADEMDIEQRSSYQPPRDTPPEPDAEALALLPRDYRFGRLSSGRVAITLTTYVGRDYSGRWGNFISHTLVLSEELDRWPIDYYEWDGWLSDLGEDGDPEPLPAVDLASVAPAESFTLRELHEFLGEEPERAEWLEAMLRAVFAGRGEKRPLVVRDTPVQGLYWLACIQKALPVPQALSLSFSSYQFDTQKCSDVNITTAATAFSLNRDECEYQFYGFDLLTGEASTVPDGDGDFPAKAAHWMAHRPERLKRFHTFVQCFDYRDVDGDLTRAAHLFELLEGRASSLREAVAIEALAFAERRATPLGFCRVTEMGFRVPCAGLDARVELALLCFLIQAARRTAQVEHRRLAAAAWRDFFGRRAWAGGEALQAARQALHHLDNLGGDPRELARELVPISEALDAELADGQAPVDVLLFLLDRTVGWLLDLGVARVGSDPRVTRMLRTLSTRACGRQVLSRILESGARDPGVLAEFCSALGRPSGSPSARRPELGALLAERLRRHPEDFVLGVRQRLESRDCRHLLLAEALATIGGSEDPIEAFEIYRGQVATHLPATWRRHAGDLVEALHRCVPEQYFRLRAQIWLQEGLLAEVPLSVAKWLASVVNQQISIDPDAAGSEPHVDRLRQLGERQGLELRPDRPALRELIARARAGETRFESRDYEILSHARHLAADEYELVVEEALPAVLESTTDHEEHGRVLRNIWLPGRLPVVGRVYMDWLAWKRPTPWCEKREAALCYWLRWDSAMATEELEQLREAALKGLSKLLVRLKQALWVELVYRLDTTFSPRTAWPQLRDHLERRRKRGLRRLFR